MENAEPPVDYVDSGLSSAWKIIVPKLAEDLSLGLGLESGFVTPSVVARRYLTLGETCKEMLGIVHSDGLPILANKIAANGLLEPIAEADQVINTMEGIALKDCVRMPLECLLAVRLEKQSQTKVTEKVEIFRRAMDSCILLFGKSVFAIRLRLSTMHRVFDEKDWEAAYQTAKCRIVQLDSWSNNIYYTPTRRKRSKAQRQRDLQRCRCGNLASPACRFLLCKYCCDQKRQPNQRCDKHKRVL